MIRMLVSIGAGLPIDETVVRYASGALLGVAGLVLIGAPLHDRLSGMFTPLASAAARRW
jgi:hypothetical protein